METFTLRAPRQFSRTPAAPHVRRTGEVLANAMRLRVEHSSEGLAAAHMDSLRASGEIRDYRIITQTAEQRRAGIVDIEVEVAPAISHISFGGSSSWFAPAIGVGLASGPDRTAISRLVGIRTPDVSVYEGLRNLAREMNAPIVAEQQLLRGQNSFVAHVDDLSFTLAAADFASLEQQAMSQFFAGMGSAVAAVGAAVRQTISEFMRSLAETGPIFSNGMSNGFALRAFTEYHTLRGTTRDPVLYVDTEASFSELYGSTVFDSLGALIAEPVDLPISPVERIAAEMSMEPATEAPTPSTALSAALTAHTATDAVLSRRPEPWTAERIAALGSPNVGPPPLQTGSKFSLQRSARHR